MLEKKTIETARERAFGMLKRAGIAITEKELLNMEITDFGLNDLKSQGLEIIVYENNDRYCAKELILFPFQTCPEHRHPDRGDVKGKMETFRCRRGKVFLYVPGNSTTPIQAVIPAGSEDYYTVFQEIELNPGDQYTIPGDTLHWFQGGPEGAIVSEFSSPSDDASDIFTDPNIKRITED